MNPEISIVIAAYNVAPYIAQAVESALSQIGVTLEVIVVEDASTDRTRDILSRLHDPRIRIILSDRNGGPAAARNAGFAAATGAWIAVLDGDDLLLPGRLTRGLTRAQHTAADIVVDNLLVHREVDGSEFPMFPPKHFNRLNTVSLSALMRETLPGQRRYGLGYLKPMFRTGFLRKHGLAYDTGLRIGEDYRLLAEALALGARCVVEPSVGYRYTARGGSLSYRLSLEHLEQMMAADEAFAARHTLDEQTALAQRHRRFLHREIHAYTRLVTAIKTRDRSAALAAIRECPTALRHLWEPLWKRVPIA